MSEPEKIDLANSGEKKRDASQELVEEPAQEQPPKTKPPKKKKEKSSAKKERFIKPTLEEVKAYCLERKNTINAEQFIDYYEANGWRVGRSLMKDWKASVRTWERNRFNNPKPPIKSSLHMGMLNTNLDKW